MDVDLHIHTTYSDCSGLDYDRIHGYVQDNRPLAFTITDHGSVAACRRLTDDFPGLTVLWGIEVTAEEGDFLVFTEDIDYISSLKVYHRSVEDLRRDDDTVVIWAHPRISQSGGWTGPDVINDEIRHVTDHIDGLELFNGTMLFLATLGSIRPIYFEKLHRILQTTGLTATGGSDAHDFESLFNCYTRFPDDVRTAADMITVLKNGKVEPLFDGEHFNNLEIPILSK